MSASTVRREHKKQNLPTIKDIMTGKPTGGHGGFIGKLHFQNKLYFWQGKGGQCELKFTEERKFLGYCMVGEWPMVVFCGYCISKKYTYIKHWVFFEGFNFFPGLWAVSVFVLVLCGISFEVSVCTRGRQGVTNRFKKKTAF